MIGSLVTYLQAFRALHRAPPGDRAPFIVHLARRHLVALEEIGLQPRPAEPAGADRRRRRHRRELEHLHALARVLGLTVPEVSDVG